MRNKSRLKLQTLFSDANFQNNEHTWSCYTRYTPWIPRGRVCGASVARLVPTGLPLHQLPELRAPCQCRFLCECNPLPMHVWLNGPFPTWRNTRVVGKRLALRGDQLMRLRVTGRTRSILCMKNWGQGMLLLRALLLPKASQEGTPPHLRKKSPSC